MLNENFNDEYDEMCMIVLENAQGAGLCDVAGKIYFYKY